MKKYSEIFEGDKLGESGGLILVAGKQGSGRTTGLQKIVEPYSHGDIASLSIVDTHDGLEWFELSGQTETFLVGEDLLAIHELLTKKAALVGVRSRMAGEELDVIVIDEIVELFDEGERSESEKLLIRSMKRSVMKIAHAGRAYGVVLIVTTEKPVTAFLPVWRNLADLRIAFRLSSFEAEAAVLGPGSEGEPSPVAILEQTKNVAVVVDCLENTREFVLF